MTYIHIILLHPPIKNDAELIALTRSLFHDRNIRQVC